MPDVVEAARQFAVVALEGMKRDLAIDGHLVDEGAADCWCKPKVTVRGGNTTIAHNAGTWGKHIDELFADRKVTGVGPGHPVYSQREREQMEVAR